MDQQTEGREIASVLDLEEHSDYWGLWEEFERELNAGENELKQRLERRSFVDITGEQRSWGRDVPALLKEVQGTLVTGTK